MLLVDRSSDTLAPRQPIIHVVGLGPDRYHLIERQWPNGQSFQFRYRIALPCRRPECRISVYLPSRHCAAWCVPMLLRHRPGNSEILPARSADTNCGDRLQAARRHRAQMGKHAGRHPKMRGAARIADLPNLSASRTFVSASCSPRYNSRMPRKLGPYSSPYCASTSYKSETLHVCWHRRPDLIQRKIGRGRRL